jgi:hypothetical protein
MLPWAVVLAAIGGAIWWLLSRGTATGRLLLAALLLGHGIVHLLFVVPASKEGEPWPFDMAKSWAVTGIGLDLGGVRAVGVVLIAIAICAFAVAALSTVGIVVPAGWWRSAVGGCRFGGCVRGSAGPLLRPSACAGPRDRR